MDSAVHLRRCAEVIWFVVLLHVCVCTCVFDTWTCTILRHGDISRQAKSSKLKDSYDEDPELTAQLHRTLADFEANIAGEGASITVHWIYIFSLMGLFHAGPHQVTDPKKLLVPMVVSPKYQSIMCSHLLLPPFFQNT